MLIPVPGIRRLDSHLLPGTRHPARLLSRLAAHLAVPGRCRAAQDAATYAEWGVDYLKFDYCDMQDTKESVQVGT